MVIPRRIVVRRYLVAKCFSMASIICADVISPLSARCMLVGQTEDMKSAVCGTIGSGFAKASESIDTFTKRAGCGTLAAPLLVTVSCPVASLNLRLLSLSLRNAIHFHAASLTFEVLNMAVDSSPKYVQRPPPQDGTGTAETLSPSASLMVFALPM